MHRLYEDLLRLWAWLSKEDVSRVATGLLVFITAWYAILTYRMAKAMNRQTNAMIQPVLSMDFRIEKEEFYPKGSFDIRNLGAQPALLLDTRLRCYREGTTLFHKYEMYERHILPPQDRLGFNFDLTEDFRKAGFTWWTPGICSYTLEVVASDLSQDIVLAYSRSAYWQTLRVEKGMPIRVWWKFFYGYIRSRYYRIVYKFRKPKPLLIPNDAPKLKPQTWAWLRGKSTRQNSDSHDGQ